MKNRILCLLLLANTAFAQVKKGEVVPEINFSQILNAPVKQSTLSSLKGKIVLIEFWATWCGSCIEAIPQLNQLQTKYGDRLQLITITDETLIRTAQFLKARPSKLWYVSDTARNIAKLFPHQLIPHTVLISPEGKFITATAPENITAAVIDSVWNKQQVHLPEKKDQLLSYQEVIQTRFFAADTVKKRFVMESAIKNVSSVSTAYMNSPVFKNRRITVINQGLKSLYRIAYNSPSSKRYIDKTAQDENSPLYCLDIIVEDEKDLRPVMQKELLKRFDLKAHIEQQNMEVYVLKVDDYDKFKKVPVSQHKQRTYFSRHGEIDQQAVNMTEFADYLENFGTSGKRPVVNETNQTGKFDIKFSFQPEDPESLIQVLKDMGLCLEKTTRTIGMLVLHK